MRLKCDYCRSDLGAGVRRYCQMRFCSAACVDAYQRRLGDDTKLKIRRLGFAALGNSRNTGFNSLDGVIRHPPG